MKKLLGIYIVEIGYIFNDLFSFFIFYFHCFFKIFSKWNVDLQMTKFKLALSHDETKLLSAGHTIKMWDLQSKQVLKTFNGHATRITNIMFSTKDEICISSAEHDRFINIWKCQDRDSNNINLAGKL